MHALSRRSFGGLLLSAGGIAALGAVGAVTAATPTTQPIQSLKLTVLSTMLAEPGLGEWGFSALVELADRRFLFDTGAHPDLVLSNAKDLQIDLASIDEVVISHNHWDHVGGLLALRRESMKTNPKALSVAHVSSGVFTPRLDQQGKNKNGLASIADEYRVTGGQWVLHDRPTALLDGVWFTGPVPRPNDERNWKPGLRLPDASGAPGPEDNVPEDSALIFDTPKGLVILTGCGHAGVVNIGEYARQAVRAAPLEAIVGGLHLFAATDPQINWTAGKLKAMGLRHLLAAHCTGIEATYKLRDGVGLDRKTATVSAVGSWYDLADGIHPGALAG